MEEQAKYSLLFKDVEYNAILANAKRIVRSNLQKVNREGVGFLETNIEKLEYEVAYYTISCLADLSRTFNQIETTKKYTDMLCCLSESHCKSLGQTEELILTLKEIQTSQLSSTGTVDRAKWLKRQMKKGQNCFEEERVISVNQH